MIFDMLMNIFIVNITFVLAKEKRGHILLCWLFLI